MVDVWLPIERSLSISNFVLTRRDLSSIFPHVNGPGIFSEELGPQESFGQQIKSISVVFTGMFLLLVYDSLDVTESDSGIGKSLAPTPEFSTKK